MNKLQLILVPGGSIGSVCVKPYGTRHGIIPSPELVADAASRCLGPVNADPIAPGSDVFRLTPAAPRLPSIPK